MNILIISLDKTLIGQDYSGDVLERHLEYSKKAGHLDIIVFSKKGFQKKEISKQLSIYPTNSRIKLNYIFDALKIARRIIARKKIDLVVTQEPFITALTGWRIKKTFKIPLLVHFHGDFWGNRYWLKEKWYNFILLLLSKFLVKKADGIRVVSSGIKNKLIKNGISENKVRVIPTPVDLDKFICKSDNRKGNVVINVGRNDPSKDFKTLLKAIELVKQQKNIVFHQIGAGFDIGKVSQKELIDYYCQSDIYVSSSCHESFGKVLVEAMAAGLALVATATTGSQEIIQDKINGFLVPIGDKKTLAEKIIYLIENPDIAKQMGKAGKKIVEEKFSQKENISKIINFWQDLVNK